MLKSLWSTAAAVLSIAGLSACATPEARYPIQPDPLAAAPAVVEPMAAAALVEPAVPSLESSQVVETPRAAPLGAVQTTELPQLAPAGQASPPRPLASAPLSVDATLSHVVGVGDTFYAIGRRYGVGPQAVAEVNGFSFADTLKLGQRVQLPVGARDRGAEAARSPPAFATPSGAALNVSLQPPARSTLVEPEQPVTVPAPVIPTPSTVVPAQAPAPIAVPPASSPVIAAPPQPLVAPPVIAPPLFTPVPVPAQPRLAPTIPSASAVPATSAALGRGLFVWPLRGDLISGFGPKGVGQRSDGLNIAAAEGDSVRASAAGTVVYAGDQVKGGFGKLVLIEHENRWFTAYAHLSEITVRMREKVTQNQTLGRAGRTGSVGAPQLYFEVRHAPAAGDRARPVDPAPLLP